MSPNSSKRPLYKKLGIKSDAEILVLNSPKNYIAFFSDFPDNVLINEMETGPQVEFIHIFVKTRNELENLYKIAKTNLKKNGSLWISWPKKAAKITTEVDKFMIMNYVLDDGLVDTKVASIDEIWSGLKFVYRLKDR